MRRSVTYTRGFVINSALRCFVAEGGDASAALREVGLPEPEKIDPGDVILSEQYYELIHLMTDMIDDPYFPARIGQRLAREGVSVFVEARKRSKTIGEFLIRLQASMRKAVTSGVYELRNDGARAVLSIKRRMATKASTTPVDTLNAAAFITLFEDELGKQALRDCTVSLPDAAALPTDILPGRQVFKSRDGSMRLQFPAAWLQAEFKRQAWVLESISEEEALSKPVYRFELAFVRQRIAERLGPDAPTLEAVAGDFALSARQLQRLLQAEGQTFRELVHQERLRRAKHLLETTDAAVIRIAELSGFSSAQAFAKSFRAAFGEPPTGFRSRARQIRF